MNPSSNTKAIIGKDDRTVLKSPVSARPVAVLKVKEDYGSRSLCYATLTSPMILTTAAHCLEYLTFEHLGQRHLRNHISADFDYSEKRLITDIIDVFEDLDLVQLRLDKPMIQSPLAPGRGVNTYDPYLPLTILTAPQTILETININPR
jgi:hypothetical protein